VLILGGVAIGTTGDRGDAPARAIFRL